MGRVRILIALAIGCAGVLVQAPAAGASACAGAEEAAGAQSEAQLEASVLCLVNERRSGAGLDSVRPDPRLRRAAFRHSRDMVEAGFFAHTSPSGESFIERIVDTGYLRGARSWLVGENLVWGSGQMSTPASMVEAWMKSPPHRANLLRNRFREIGIGAVRGTPFDAGEGEGITVSSEYGYRFQKKRRSSGRHSKAKKSKRFRGRR